MKTNKYYFRTFAEMLAGIPSGMTVKVAKRQRDGGYYVEWVNIFSTL